MNGWIMFLIIYGTNLCFHFWLSFERRKTLPFKNVFEPVLYLKFFSNNSLPLYFCVAELRGRCWGASRPQRGRAAEGRVRCTAPPVTAVGKKTPAVTE